MTLTDTSFMPFGKFRGKPMQDLPVSYLHWFYCNNSMSTEAGQAVIDYITISLDALKMENRDLIWKRN